MRYDKPIYFQKVLSGEYDANTGDYGADSVEETRKYASIMDTGTETMNVVYGTLKQGSKTVQLLRPHTKPFGVMVGLGVALAGMMAGMVLVLKTLAPMSAQLMPVATAMLALGAAVLIVSAGFALLALTSIQLANAGGLAIGIMIGMVATIALLAVGAAALGPALTAGALGFVAFGTAIVLVATGALLASAALAIVATVLPTVCEYGLQGAFGNYSFGSCNACILGRSNSSRNWMCSFWQQGLLW